MTATRRIAQRLKSLTFVLLMTVWQLGFALSPMLQSQTAYAANEITATDHEGQLQPSGSYSNGNITTYTELESINFRFTLDSSAVADGQMQVEFTGTDQFCEFFDGTFTLGTHDSSATSVVNVSAYLLQ